MASTAIDVIVPDCDLDDVEACRGKVIAAIEDPAFQSILDDLRATSAAAQNGAMPRAWSVDGSVSADTTVAGVKVKVKIGGHVDNKP